MDVPLELTMDRIAQRYNVGPWEVEQNASTDWLEIISMIVEAESGKVSQEKSQDNLHQKISEKGKRFK